MSFAGSRIGSKWKRRGLLIGIGPLTTLSVAYWSLKLSAKKRPNHDRNETQQMEDEMKLSMVAVRDKRIENLERGTSIMGMKMCEYLARIEELEGALRAIMEAHGPGTLCNDEIYEQAVRALNGPPPQDKTP